MNVITIIFLASMGLGLSQPNDSAEQLGFPNIPVIDQNGQKRLFYDDLIQGKTVVINFIFTRCPSVCPPMGANFAALQKRLGEKSGENLSLISVSIDPVGDTPARLKAWRERFGGKDGWTLVTGEKHQIDQLLKSLRVFAADIDTHSPFVILRTEAGKWQYLSGLTRPEVLLKRLAELRVAKEPLVEEGATPKRASLQQAPTASPAQRYFDRIFLQDQYGETRRFYQDLVADRTVIMHTFFSSCQGVCPVLMNKMDQVRERLGDQLGQRVRILSISVDPRRDTAEKLRQFAERYSLPKGWYLLSGKPAQVEHLLRKLGQFVETPEGHGNLIIVGNDKTGLWKKVNGVTTADQWWPVIESVVRDRG